MMKALMIAALTLLVSSQAMAATYTINGTSGDDEIVLGRLQTRSGATWTTQPGYAYYLNGVITQFTASSSSFVDIRAGAGSDGITIVSSVTGTLSVNSNNRLIAWPSGLQPVFVDGGLGRDLIFGSDYADILYGHQGSDEIYGEGGADHIVGNIAASGTSDPYCVGIEEMPVADSDACLGGPGNDDIYCFPVSQGDGGTDTCVAGTSGVIHSSCEVEDCG